MRNVPSQVSECQASGAAAHQEGRPAMARNLPRMILLLAMALPWASLHARQVPLPDTLDSDRDGLPDSLEDALLARFAPVFMVSRTDCASLPAQFAPANPVPTVIADGGTVYGQAFPRKGHA